MWGGFQFIPFGTRIPFIRQRMVFFAFSATLVLASVILVATRGLNYGIDFMGGLMVEVRTPGTTDLGPMRRTLSDLGLGAVELQTFGAPNEVMIRLQRQEGDE